MLSNNFYSVKKYLEVFNYREHKKSVIFSETLMPYRLKKGMLRTR